MPNTNSPFGLLPIGVQIGATPSFQINRIMIPTTTGVCARGDGLQRLATGFMSPVVAAAVGAISWSGIVWGFKFLSAALGRTVVTQYYPGSGSATGDVELSYIPLGSSWPSVRIKAQATGTPFTRAMVGANMDITYTAPSAILRGGSSQVAIAAVDASTLTLPWRLVQLWSDIARDGGVDDTASFNWGVFEFNNAGIIGI